jgi:hypothetical protein
MKSSLEALIRSYNSRQHDVTAKLLGIENNIITVRFSGMRPETFLDDFKSELEQKTNSRLLVEKVQKDNGNRIVKFAVHEEKGPADDILEALSKYYEGAPPPKHDFED